LRRGIELRTPNTPSIPSLKRVSSVNEFSGLWQLAQDCELFPESFLSKNNFFPRATPSSVRGLLFGINGAINFC